MRLLSAIVVGTVLVAVGAPTTAGAYEISGGPLFTPFALDLVRCAVVHADAKRSANYDLRLYNAAGTLVASQACSDRGLGEPCWIDHDPTGTGHLCIVGVKGVPSKLVRGSLCAHENTSGNPIACVPLTRR